MISCIFSFFFALSLILPLMAESSTSSSMPPFIQVGAKPNIILILDNSNSMDEDFYGNAVGSFSPASKSVVGFGNGHHDHKLPEPVFLSCARSTRSNENVFSGYKVRFFYESGYYLDVLVVRSCLPFIIRHIFVTAEYHRSFNGFTGFFLRGDIF